MNRRIHMQSFKSNVFLYPQENSNLCDVGFIYVFSIYLNVYLKMCSFSNFLYYVFMIMCIQGCILFINTLYLETFFIQSIALEIISNLFYQPSFG